MTTENDNDAAREGFVGRGALKLRAAFDLLGGKEKVRGARCIDVGASTGGFTELMLQLGAKAVTAIDVGHDQLAEKLKADKRVTNLEKTNFKTVSLKVAPGPFDFFAMDVSFVSARTMLRPLGFRLAKGAEGVILVKPQFELPTGYVKGGDVKPESLRKWALTRVVKKGEELGFELLGTADSPVVGGSGSVEILTRWRFKGMPEEMRGSVPEVSNEPARLVATTLPGLEAAALKELKPLVTKAEPGKLGVELEATPAELAELGQQATTVRRLLSVLGEARTADLEKAVEKWPWKKLFPDGATLVVERLGGGDAGALTALFRRHVPKGRRNVRLVVDERPKTTRVLLEELALKSPEVATAMAALRILGGAREGLPLFELSALDAAKPAADHGLVLVDALERDDFEQLGEVLKTRFAGWDAAVLVRDAYAARKRMGLRTLDEHKLTLDGAPAAILRYRLKAAP